MIAFELTIPQRILKLQALLRRLRVNYVRRPEIEDELGRCMAGYKGEKSLGYYLNFLPEKEVLILHGLRLSCNNSFFQVDILILSKSFFLIIEVKNISGELLFDDTFKQLIRLNEDGTKESFSDPLQQVKHQKFQFDKWLEENKVSGFPVEHLVVMANPKSILKTTNPKSEYVNKVLHSIHLLEKINEMQAAYPKDVLTLKQIRSLSKRLIRSNVPEDPDILNLFDVAKTDLITGVQCPNCENAPMKRKSGKWICLHCKTSSKDAHVQALQDYALLMDKTISNQEARKFLQIESPAVAYKLLQSTGATPSGKNRTRVYHLKS